MEIERRSFGRIEARGAEGEVRRLASYAAVFNQLSENLGGFREVIAPGAFAAALADDVRALINHNESLVLGRNRAGTLRLAEDETGLAIEIDPPDTQAARDLLVSVARGDVNQMSFAFRTVADDWNMRDGEVVRTLKAVRLVDVSVVTYPAYPQTEVAVRGLAAWREAEARSRLTDAEAMRRYYEARAREAAL